ncbi:MULTISPECIES: LytTR family DNA-binding domain-containing protein [unclassified Spirosoma]|uniref:LytR/AlgR family response regulator transcription factor n=1 Tax=unclassified Spirosoma TaxID=2621999 RepID=UPI00096310C9|nr:MULTISPECIES: LytTR family DNA-binding domain-containing protein [unclassified Spirosoma]MBN8826592.1 response regulator transcription factor [Spirosoma sp.]OJW72837.1 MAG: DNA-binding response regulator [Spirosoma sp. 48-14]
MIRCIAVDDEVLALEVIENYVEKLPDLELIRTCQSALSALQLLTQTPIDLMFLDINMPDLTGLQLLRTLKDPPAVILTTAYPQYALEGFELDVVDYLIKPIPFDRFVKAVQRVSNRLQNAEPVADKAIETASVDEPEYIFIKTEYKTVRIDVKDIIYLEGMKDYVRIHTSQTWLMTLLSLSKLLEKLPARQFVRVHRSYIVAVSRIDSLERNRIRIGQVQLPIGELYRDELMKRIG